MIDFLLQVLWETWNIFKQASIFLLFGFLLAGVLAVLVPEKALSKLFRQRQDQIGAVGVGDRRAVAAVFVRCGAGRAGLAAPGRHPGRHGCIPHRDTRDRRRFHQPELCADGSDHHRVPSGRRGVHRDHRRDLASISSARARQPEITQSRPASRRGRGRTACGERARREPCSRAFTTHARSLERGRVRSAGRRSRWSHRVGHPARASRVYHYAFRQLLDDTSYWVVLGIVLSGIVAAALPPTFFEQYLSNELVSMLVMLAHQHPDLRLRFGSHAGGGRAGDEGAESGRRAGVPAGRTGHQHRQHRHAAASFLGARIVAIYLASIVVVALLAGFALNWVYRDLGHRSARDLRRRDRIHSGAGKGRRRTAAHRACSCSACAARAVPGEWIWLRDRFAALTGLRLTAASAWR